MARRPENVRAAKEPWQMTREEFDEATDRQAEAEFAHRKYTADPETHLGMNLSAGMGGVLRKAFSVRHTKAGKRRAEYRTDVQGEREFARRLAVQDALAEGKPVPPEVLDELA